MGRVMNEEVEEMERNINNITYDTLFQSPATKSVQEKDASWSLERRLAAGVLAEMVENFKECSIQSGKQVDDISDSKEQVDARNWLRIDSFEEVDVLNDTRNSIGSVSGYRWIALWITSIHNKNFGIV